MAKNFQSAVGDGGYINQTTNVAAAIGSGSYLNQTAQAGHAKPGNQGGHTPPISPPPRPVVRSVVTGVVYGSELRRRRQGPRAGVQTGNASDPTR